jgi:hypothetical protein
MSKKPIGKRAKSRAPFEPLHRSVYIGRECLGRYVQTDKKRFEAFAPSGRRLGIFRSAKATLAAIRNSADAREAAE